MTVSPLRVDDLTPAQQQAVTTGSATVCVMAAAGAGKTRVLTRRVAYRVASGRAEAAHVLAITFTRKAAGELRERLGALGLPGPVTAGTFHSLAVSQLRRWWADRRAPEPNLLERKARLLGELTAGRPGFEGANLADLASHVEWAKARLVEPVQFVEAVTRSGREMTASPEAVASLYARYEDEKRKRRLVDFDDLLARYADALCRDERFAAAQRWRWQHLFVDELQDVNPLQCRLLTSLLGDNEDLFVVGDPNQAIYGWNGADPGFLTSFPQRWPRCEVVRLDDNHRSSPQVVAAATAALGRQATTTVRSSQPDGPLPQLRSYPSEDAEAAGTAHALLSAHRAGADWASMAVLARTNSQLEVIADVLAKAGVPFRNLGPATVEGTAPGAPELAVSGAGAGEGSDKVTLCTFHRSKGLQWQAVWLCGLEAGLVPIAYAASNAALAEERRLLYVAMTRAERLLHCSWARSRRAGNGAALRREPSPWLATLSRHCAGTAEMDDVVPADDATSPSWGGRNGADMIDFFTSARRRLGYARPRPSRRGRSPEQEAAWQGEEQDEPREATDELVVRLREWRRRLARASGVPPYVLLHDATVVAIAARKPMTLEELMAVPGMGPVKVSRYGPAVLEVVSGGTPSTVRAGA